MKVEALYHRLGGFRLTLIVMVALLLMAYFGFELAHFQHQYRASALQTLNQTMQGLKRENESLTTKVNQLQVQRELAKMELENVRKEAPALREKIRQLEEQLAFYQRVMAPEITQDGFLVSGLQVNPAASPGFYRASFVLLQQREIKAIVKGNLDIHVTGSLDGKPATLNAGSAAFLPDGAIPYRFKYFQTVNLQFTLPQGFVPEFIQFSTTVYQYTTKRGDYFQQFAWQDVLETQQEISVSGDGE